MSKFHLSFLETLPRGHTRYNRLQSCPRIIVQYREQKTKRNRVPDFHITEIFVPFQGSRLLDKVHAATRRHLVSQEPSSTRVRSFREHRIESDNTVSRPVKRREARAIRDSSFVEIRANFSYDRTILINGKASRVKTSRYYRRTVCLNGRVDSRVSKK